MKIILYKPTVVSTEQWFMTVHDLIEVIKTNAPNCLELGYI